MSSRKHSTEQIIRKLREAEVELAKGRSVQDVCKQLGVTMTCPHELYQFYVTAWTCSRAL